MIFNITDNQKTEKRILSQLSHIYDIKNLKIHYSNYKDIKLNFLLENKKTTPFYPVKENSFFINQLHKYLDLDFKETLFINSETTYIDKKIFSVQTYYSNYINYLKNNNYHNSELFKFDSIMQEIFNNNYFLISLVRFEYDNLFINFGTFINKFIYKPKKLTLESNIVYFKNNITDQKFIFPVNKSNYQEAIDYIISNLFKENSVNIKLEDSLEDIKKNIQILRIINY